MRILIYGAGVIGSLYAVLHSQVQKKQWVVLDTI